MIRIVMMTFQKDQVEAFLSVFQSSKDQIRAFPGCERLELLQDRDHPNVLMTYSWWKNAEDLESYRHSDLFKQTWAKTKPLFAEKPRAWSVDQLAVLP